MKLSEEQVSSRLQTLQGWLLADETTIRKTYLFREFYTGIRFVNEVARIAQELNHHPVIHIEYTKVTLSLSTHEVNGLSDLDFRSAAHYDASFGILLHE
ncbi:4a-hydroxytetrahydrobiopterin dehydratase [Paenibacillus sp. GP183]|jgi:4a-hydroxytetrahydrobiopterin dehydratase|uniref:4a-hydroxytetrahydrobiopterin dehydratase n=1 Tax=Paenibacillus sp. GP183 TaxID=1882751 RepID=UPI00089BFDF6|nr:4a-hydroxytetrahydrobiopterin dehydratase [Paenibacillus sp. GP183]SEC23243.1 pterin-4-alpha-carbinolamine dehydratase [Paenibacillus sp. GP183]